MFLAHSGAGTSGGELEEESWKPPDPELTQKLVSQIEYYLSDENLEHDAFLLKHVRRNKLGFVSVKLLTSFKKVTQELCLCFLYPEKTQLSVNQTFQARAVRRKSFLCSCSHLIAASRVILPCTLRH